MKPQCQPFCRICDRDARHDLRHDLRHTPFLYGCAFFCRRCAQMAAVRAPLLRVEFEAMLALNLPPMVAQMALCRRGVAMPSRPS